MTQNGSIEDESKFVLRLDTIPEKPMPFTMFAEIFIAHQRIVEIVARANGKNATIPELEVVRIREGSIEIQGAIHSLQMMAPLVKPLMVQAGEAIKEKFLPKPKDDEISVTETRTYKRSVTFSSGITKQLSDPVAGGYIRSMVAEMGGQELYRLDETNVPQAILNEEPPALPENTTEIEIGEDISLEGELIEMNWRTHRGKVKTALSGRPKQYDCYVEDTEFIQTQKTGLSTRVLALATPEFKVNALGEREIRLLRLNNLIIVKDPESPS